MKFQVNRDVFSEAVSFAVKLLPQRTTLPILSGVLIETTDTGLTLSSFDYEVSAQTQIAAGAQLPRIAFRESDGLYLATYQTGSTSLHLHVETTTDVHDWSADARDFAATGNNHDSLPVVMPDDAFVVFYIRAAGNQFDVAFRRSLDGIDWADPVAVTDTPDADDVEPHPLVGDSASSVELYWGRDEPAGSLTHDIVREARVVVNDVIFGDSFES